MRLITRRPSPQNGDPSWCPVWLVEWQRSFHLTRLHLEEVGSERPTEPGLVGHRGEDLGRWMKSVRLGRDKLTTVQQWMCEQVLGSSPRPMMGIFENGRGRSSPHLLDL